MNLRFLTLFFLLALFTSCVKQVNSSQNSSAFSSVTTKSYPIQVDIGENDSSYFERLILIDLSANEFLLSNFSGVLGYKIEGLKFNVSDFQGNELSKADFTISYASANETSLGSSLIYSDIPLKEFSELQHFLYVSHSASTLALAQEVMKVENQLYIKVQGNVDLKPATFTSTFYINIRISSL